MPLGACSYTYSLSRLGATVTVVSDAVTRAWLNFRTRGFFSWIDDPSITSGWTIFAGPELAPVGRWRNYRRDSPTGESCTFRVNADARAVVVDLPPGSLRQLYVLRIARNILRWQLFHDGAIFLHACCVAQHDRGLVLLGRSGSGKTTLTLSLLRSGIWDFVTEDDLTVIPKSDGTFLALGWPGCARLRRNMLPQFPELVEAASQLSHPSNAFEENLLPDVGRLRVFPEELSAAFGCKSRTEAVLDSFVWVDWGNEATMFRVSPAETASRLYTSWDILPERKAGARPHQQNGLARDWSKLVFDPFLLEIFGVPTLDFHKQILSSLASRVPGYLLTHNGRISSELRFFGNRPAV